MQKLSDISLLCGDLLYADSLCADLLYYYVLVNTSLFF